LDAITLFSGFGYRHQILRCFYSKLPFALQYPFQLRLRLPARSTGIESLLRIGASRFLLLLLAPGLPSSELLFGFTVRWEFSIWVLFSFWEAIASIPTCPLSSTRAPPLYDRHIGALHL
jgi:hypothetical protein